ncbi:hypothetical protein [Candidatus Poriferisodalis sp.]|uniref:hypothetical protein n=1 Tax=Candidatus Poriferisodalis sp. TaxID=3101277 RepID=UPI003B52F79D
MSKKDERDAAVVWPDGDLCRRVVLDGVEVALERRDGVWVVVGEERLASEARLLDVLGQPNEALERARGVAAALNADLVRPDQVSALARRLARIWARGSRSYGRLRVDERDALAVACAHLDVVEGVWEFVCWVLAKRLEWSLRRVAWVPPGRHAWLGATCWEFDTTLDRRLGAEFFAAMAAHPDQRFRDLVAATDPGADPGRLAELARCGDENLRDLIAVNPSTPVEALESLGCRTAHDYADVCVRLRVLQNPSTPADLIAKAAVARTENRFEQRWWQGTTAAALQRSWAIRHPRCPSSLLRDLTSHSDPRVRAVVAGSRRAPARVLEALAPSLDTDVRAAVAANPNTPQTLLERAGADPHRSVRAAAAANPNTPQTLLERVARDRVVIGAACRGREPRRRAGGAARLVRRRRHRRRRRRRAESQHRTRRPRPGSRSARARQPVVGPRRSPPNCPTRPQSCWPASQPTPTAKYAEPSPRSRAHPLTRSSGSQHGPAARTTTTCC